MKTQINDDMLSEKELEASICAVLNRLPIKESRLK